MDEAGFVSHLTRLGPMVSKQGQLRQASAAPWSMCGMDGVHVRLAGCLPGFIRSVIN